MIPIGFLVIPEASKKLKSYRIPISLSCVAGLLKKRGIVVQTRDCKHFVYLVVRKTAKLTDTPPMAEFKIREVVSAAIQLRSRPSYIGIVRLMWNLQEQSWRS